MDFDTVLSMNMEEYRKEFPYPYFYNTENIYRYRDRDSKLAPWHFFQNTLIIALAITIFRWAFYKFVLVPTAKNVNMRPKHYHIWYESVMQVLYYSISWSFCASYVLRSEYFYDTYYIWEGDFPRQPMDWEVYWLYALNLGWYVHCVYAHFTLDSRKSDFWEMLIHHIVTIVMLYASLILGYWRLGTIVLFTHDICDVFLYMPKVIKYFTEGLIKLPEWVWVACFAPLPFVWIIFRLILYPLKVMYPSMYHCIELVGFEHCYYYTFFNPLLVVLLALQIYWFYLIMRVVLRTIKGSKVEDIRMDETVRRDLKKDKNSKKTKKKE